MIRVLLFVILFLFTLFGFLSSATVNLNEMQKSSEGKAKIAIKGPDNVEDFCNSRERGDLGKVGYDGLCDEDEDGFTAFINMINTTLKWLVRIALFIAVATGFWGGILYTISAADPGKRSQAKSLFLSSVIGLFIILTAWLIVDLVVSTLTTQEFSGLKK